MPRLNIGNLVRIKYTATPPPPAWAEIHTEDFECGWFIDSIFNSILVENFEINWFIDNLLNSQFTENFEDPSWMQ